MEGYEHVENEWSGISPGFFGMERGWDETRALEPNPQRLNPSGGPTAYHLSLVCLGQDQTSQITWELLPWL